jgi:predicted permease
LNPVVLSSLLPVVAVIAIGYACAHSGIIRQDAIKDLSNLAFLVLTPALLFRTMASVHVEQLDFVPAASYLIGALVLFFTTLMVVGFHRRGAVLALACTFSNTVMIGIPLVSFAYGDAGLVVLLTLVSIHALVLLTTGTMVLELSVAREKARFAQSVDGSAAAGLKSRVRTVLSAARSSVLHPVPLPILVGLVFAQTGIAIPAAIDKPLLWLGGAFGPLALLLVGMTLAGHTAKAHWNTAMGLAVAKNVALPLLVAATAHLLGVGGLHLTVMVVAASMPIGANVFLFSQRYQVAQGEVTAAVALSTLLALVTVTVVMTLLGTTL